MPTYRSSLESLPRSLNRVLNSRIIPGFLVINPITIPRHRQGYHRIFPHFAPTVPTEKLIEKSINQLALALVCQHHSPRLYVCLLEVNYPSSSEGEERFVL